MKNNSKNTDRRSLGLAALRKHQIALQRQESMVVRVDGLVKIPLTQGKWAIVDESDWGAVKVRKWFALKSYNTFYARTRSFGKNTTVSMHKVILQTKPPFMVDHKDGNGLNNSRANLRVCTNSQNCQNSRMKSSNSTGYKGVAVNSSGNSFMASICVNGRQKHLGYFKILKDAARAYNEAASRHHGEFASLNKI